MTGTVTATVTVPAPARASAGELDELRGSVRAFLEARSPEAAVRRVTETELGHDPELWRQLADQLGLPGLVAPEAAGGAGYGVVELGVVLEEFGRALYPGPFLSSAVATWALAHVPDSPECAPHLPDLAAGSRRATVALGRFDQRARASSGVRSAAGRLTGTVEYVLDAAGADLLVVEARTCSGAALYLVDPAAPGVTIRPRNAVDRTRRLADVVLDAVPGQWFAGPETVARVHAVAAIALACGQVGGAEAALHAALGYARLRTQFGRAIGSFQSIKHHCAELFLAVESGRAAAARAARAARAVDEDDPELELLASIAKVWCSQTYVRAAEVSLQIHGGIGFTWEHPAHLHLKRAKTDELLFGSPAAHRTHLAQLLGLAQETA